ncbi:MAG: NTP transferase domain-containing protein [Planctomycetaceae bacterium]|nr:NTP transferase domain-containing protein [Planctomycetaceae bacterium]
MSIQISRVGGVIAAAGGSTAKPTLRIGSVSNVQRLVTTFQQAGIFPIVVVTGVQADEVRYQLAGRGVVFLHHDDFANASLYDSARLGFEYLRGVSGRTVFSPVNAPLTAPSCLTRLLRSRAPIARLSHSGRGGHPVSLSHQAVETIMRDGVSTTLRDAMAASGLKTQWVEAGNEGAVLTVHQEREMRRHIAAHRQDYFHPRVQVTLENEEEVFTPRLKTLLFLLVKTRSVAAACRQVALSPSTAWEMTNRLEAALGYSVVLRKRGGASGSGSDLTPDGFAFLKAWQRYEEAVQLFAITQFGHIRNSLIR